MSLDTLSSTLLLFPLPLATSYGSLITDYCSLPTIHFDIPSLSCFVANGAIFPEVQSEIKHYMLGEYSYRRNTNFDNWLNVKEGEDDGVISQTRLEVRSILWLRVPPVIANLKQPPPLRIDGTQGGEECENFSTT